VRPSERRSVQLIEIAILIVSLAIANIVLRPSDPGFVSISPNPTFFITLLVIARYGLAMGIVAASASAIEYVAMVLALGHRPLFQLFAPPFSPPLVLLVPTTVFLGMLVQRHIDRRRAAESAEHVAVAREQKVSDELAALRDVNVELGEKIVNAETTMFILMDRLKALSTLDRNSLDTAVLRVMVEILRVEAGSVWQCDGTNLQLRATLGQTRPRPFQLDPAIENYFDQYDILMLQKLPIAEPNTPLPFLLGRIRAGAGGPVIGFLSVDRISLKFAPETTRLFTLLVEWFSIATGNAIAFEKRG
jgi:hypothetical protein